MDDKPLLITSYPRAIMHLDADAFFTSVEQALDPQLRGRPVVTGQERGIIACASYEAKARGIRRGIPLWQARKICPELVILPSDYETYSLYSKRMFDLMRTFTPLVEEYSVDEAFADLTGLRRLYHCSYEEIAQRIQARISDDLGFSVSVGLSLTKALAKLCSKFRKPDGFTAVRGRYVHILLQRTPLASVWGIGPSTKELLQKLGLETAYDYVQRPEAWISKLLKKPGRELWQELRGHSVWKVTTDEKSSYATIMKSKTFTPPSTEKAFVFAKLVRNVETAFMKARRYHLRARMLGVVLRRQNFQHEGLEVKLNRPTSSSLEAMPIIKTLFERCYHEGIPYRSTLIALGGLEDDSQEQYELFEDRLAIENVRRLTEAVDKVNRRFGKHTVSSATALFLARHVDEPREARHPRRRMLMKDETERQRVALPRMDLKV